MHGLPNYVYNQIKNIIEQFPNYQFKLFGSRARGDYKETSDIDIAIFGIKNNEDEWNIRNEFDKLDIVYTIDLVKITNKTKEELLNAILKEGVDF